MTRVVSHQVLRQEIDGVKIILSLLCFLQPPLGHLHTDTAHTQ